MRQTQTAPFHQFTVRNGRRALAQLFVKNFRDIAAIERWLWAKAESGKGISPANAEALGVLNDILFSPVLKHVLCPKINPSKFKPGRVILAHIDPTDLDEFVALALAYFLIHDAME